MRLNQPRRRGVSSERGTVYLSYRRPLLSCHAPAADGTITEAVLPTRETTPQSVRASNGKLTRAPTPTPSAAAYCARVGSACVHVLC